MSESNENPFKDLFSSERMERQREAFRRREAARVKIRERINTLINGISTAEAELADLEVFQAKNQYHLVKAKVELVTILRNIEKEADSSGEISHRALERISAEGKAEET
jgi:hypothetical protein